MTTKKIRHPHHAHAHEKKKPLCTSNSHADFRHDKYGYMSHYMGWLRLVDSLKLQVSFAEYRLFYRALLQKRPIILRSLIIVATPYYTCQTDENVCQQLRTRSLELVLSNSFSRTRSLELVVPFSSPEEILNWCFQITQRNFHMLRPSKQKKWVVCFKNNSRNSFVSKLKTISWEIVLKQGLRTVENSPFLATKNNSHADFSHDK